MKVSQMATDRSDEGRRCRAIISQARQKLQQSSVTAIRRIALRTVAQVRRNGPGLFRPERLIQIFPESDQNLLTLHGPYPLAMSLLTNGWRKNSRNGSLVPVAPDRHPAAGSIQA
jgi:hypothetical protein